MGGGPAASQYSSVDALGADILSPLGGGGGPLLPGPSSPL